jgi:hypothetical protein
MCVDSHDNDKHITELLRIKLDLADNKSQTFIIANINNICELPCQSWVIKHTTSKGFSGLL